MSTTLIRWLVAAALLAACGGGGDERCGPSEGVVARAIDGDTIELESGETIRYLLVDTPESTGGATDCFGENAHTFNEDLVVGKTVQLAYDVECEDHFGRLLAYVTVGANEVNPLLVERGYACVLHIPPNGDDRVDEFQALEDAARASGAGMWSACTEVTCD
jgi:micrococcal nuclease